MNKREWRGAGLLEVLLGLSIASLLIVMSYASYQRYRRMQVPEMLLNSVQLIQSAAAQWVFAYCGQWGYSPLDTAFVPPFPIPMQGSPQPISMLTTAGLLGQVPNPLNSNPFYFYITSSGSSGVPSIVVQLDVSGPNTLNTRGNTLSVAQLAKALYASEVAGNNLLWQSLPLVNSSGSMIFRDYYYLKKFKMDYQDILKPNPKPGCPF